MGDSGNLAASIIRFKPFGDYRPNSAPQAPFTGHKHNDYIKMIYMGARWYLPGVGRFISADTIVPDPTNPQSFNRYSYTRNSPVNFTDPTGHRECDFDGQCGPLPPRPVPTSPPPLGNPLEGYYDSGPDYNPDPDRDWENNPTYHNGVDLDSEITTDVVAIATGRVRVTDECGSCGYNRTANANYGVGNVVIIEYVYDVIPENIREALELVEGESIYVQYQHLDAINEKVKVGEEVHLGDIIGQFGNTGLSDGSHLHLEVHVGVAGALGRGGNDKTGTYDAYSSAWHDLRLVDPGLIWNIP